MADFINNIVGVAVPEPVLSVFSLLFVLCFIVFFISVCRR